MLPTAAHPTRVAIVGAGKVGSTFAYALMLSGLAAEIVLVDADPRRAEGEAMDLAHAVPFSKPVRIWAGSSDDCAGAAITVIAGGPNDPCVMARRPRLARRHALIRRRGQSGRGYHATTRFPVRCAPMEIQCPLGRPGGPASAVASP